jgi:hypothetical protein
VLEHDGTLLDARLCGVSSAACSRSFTLKKSSSFRPRIARNTWRHHRRSRRVFSKMERMEASSPRFTSRCERSAEK